ncbi:MAG: ADOP family duplicated permease, partial [Longimicrobiales bacterium]
EVPLRVFRIRRVRRDVEEELAFHFRETVEELMSEGQTREEAEAEAGRRFGDARRYREQLESIDREAELRRRVAFLDASRDVLKHAFRGVWRTPGLSLGIILAFGLGIGANATMYGTIERLLLRPPGQLRDADNIKQLYGDRLHRFAGERRVTATFTYPDYIDLAGASAFEGAAAYSGGSSGTRITLGRGETAVQARSRLVTGSYWDVLGTRPLIGRVFGGVEDVRGGAPVAVISYGYWRREHDGSAAVLGRTLDFGYGPYTIIGVMPKGFTGADLTPIDVWLPLNIAAYEMQGEDWATSRTWWWLHIVARLAPDATVERAAAEATAIHRNSRRELFETTDEAPDPRIVPASLIAARGPLAPPEALVAKWLAAVALLVLLIACANVANLLLARAVRQRRETGIRLALGITGGRLIGETIAQGIVLALLGALAALLLTQLGAGLVQTLLGPDLEWGSPLRRGVLAFVLGSGVVAGVLSALLPAAQASRQRVATALRDRSGGSTLSATRVRAWLCGVQAALSVVLLIGAGLFGRSLGRIRAVDLGFDTERVLLARPIFLPNTVPPAERLLVFESAAERLGGVPGVAAVALTQVVSFEGSIAEDLRAEGVDSIRSHPSGGPYVYPVGGDYFDVMGLQVRRGRAMQATDRAGSERVAVVNESMARFIWPNEEAIGKCLHRVEMDPSCSRIVGVVEDAHRQSIREPAQLLYYVPVDQFESPPAPRAILLRTDRDPARVIEAVRRTLLASDSRIRFADTRPLQELVDPQLRSWKLGATMFSLFGLLALVVAANGLYSVLSFDVAQRTREIGLRSALGASRGSILSIFVTRALKLTAYGTAIGVVTAIALGSRLEELLYETSPRDPAVITLVAVAVLGIALVAGFTPAYRAARVDPNVALRAD